MNIDKSYPIMLTGATGYVGGRIAEKLMKEGHLVHAPIRNPEKKEKTKYLDEIAKETSGDIKYFKADLLKQGSYDQAMEGCELVIHTASPFIMSSKNPQEDLISPALEGTRNVLKSANKTPSIKRVVLTSSVAAIYGDAKDIHSYPNETLTEEQWNTSSSLEKSPYNYSKVLAEKEAWKIQGDQNRWDLVVINPSFVLGPAINPNGTSESFTIMKQMADGTLKMGCADINMGCVDVRDVANAHYLAAFTPTAQGRHITSAENVSFLEIADMLRPKFGADYPLPKKNLPKWLIWLTAPMSGLTRQFVADNVGHPWKADNSKSKRELGIKYRSIHESVNEFFEQVVEQNNL